MDFETLDERFNKLFFGNARGTEALEWRALDGRFRIFCRRQVPDRLRHPQRSGLALRRNRRRSVGVRAPSPQRQRAFVDQQGRLVRCEHRSRCGSRIEHDGRCTMFASHWQAERLNSPNDLVVKSDGSIWFSDPTYGIDHDYEGDVAPSEIGAANVFRSDPSDGSGQAIITDVARPNGLAFSPDERRLHVADTGITHDPQCTPKILVYDVSANARDVSNGRTFGTCSAGLFDGMRCDIHGNLWAAASDGIHCHAPDSTLIGKMRIPQTCANLVFGRLKVNRLYICATKSLYAVYLNTLGITPWDASRAEWATS